MTLPILVSIPHGGWQVAEEIQHIWALSEKDALHDGDPFTARIYDFSDRVRFQKVMEYYRAVVDLNRQPDDIAPANPDGVIKSHTCYNVEVYQPGMLPNESLKKTLLDRYYHPYHQALQDALMGDDIRLGVDCHSMAAVSPPIEKDAGAPRPLICLGNLGDSQGLPGPPHNRVTCSQEILFFMREEFERVFQHEDVDLEPPAICSTNEPFEGGYITRQMGGKDVPFVQIEMSRALYIAQPHFDAASLQISDKRIGDLNRKVWRVLQNTVRNL
jgi:formiminoglutamase